MITFTCKNIKQTSHPQYGLQHSCRIKCTKNLEADMCFNSVVRLFLHVKLLIVRELFSFVIYSFTYLRPVYPNDKVGALFTEPLRGKEVNRG